MQTYISRCQKQIPCSDFIKNSLSEVGLTLKHAREKKSLSLNDVKEITCIPLHHLLAIEAGNREELPEDLFVTGFIKKYAKTLGISVEGIIRKYTNEKSLNMLENKSTFCKGLTKNKYNKIKNDDVNTFKLYHFYLLASCLLFGVAIFLVFSNSSLLSSDNADIDTGCYVSFCLGYNQH